jgi:hypothetical protein
MMTYQVRPRAFIVDGEDRPSFPADAELRFHFRPLQPFGMEAGGGRTVVIGSHALAVFDAFTGERSIILDPPLKPLNVTLEQPGRLLRAEGNILSVARRFDNLDQLEEYIWGLYFALPFLLNVSFADPPIIVLIDGKIGSCRFRWDLEEFTMPHRPTTQELQEAAVRRAWEQLPLLGGPTPRRLVAALHYFHVACRLSRREGIPGEFSGEILLNLSKTLEVLFHYEDQGQSMDAARVGLRGLGFSGGEIEREYVPAIALRNWIDAGHVFLSLFTMDQLRQLNVYIDQAEEPFRELLRRVLERAAAGTFEFPAKASAPKKRALNVIDLLRQHSRPQPPPEG